MDKSQMSRQMRFQIMIRSTRIRSSPALPKAKDRLEQLTFWPSFERGRLFNRQSDMSLESENGIGIPGFLPCSRANIR